MERPELLGMKEKLNEMQKQIDKLTKKIKKLEERPTVIYKNTGDICI